MGAVWETRIVKSDDGKLRFAECRFRVDTSTGIAGITTPITAGESLQEMRRIAQGFLDACERAIIGPDGEDPERLEDEEEEED